MAGENAAMPEPGDFYPKTVKECLEALKTNEKGLSNTEAQKRLTQYGENQLITLGKTPRWLQFLIQFRDVLVIILIIAGVISFAIGDFRGGSIMFIIVLINAFIGYFQEHKAERIMDSLKKLVQSPAKVYRDGELTELYLAEVFPWQNEEDIEEIRKSFPWDLKVAEELKIMEPPTERELWALRLMDSTSNYIVASVMDRPIGKIIEAGKLNLEGYDEFLGLTEKALREILEFVS
jgi:hypothetical protein